MFHALYTAAISLFTILLVIIPAPAAAYIGPGAGLGAFAIFLAFGAGIFLLIVGLVWFPLKRMLKKLKAKRAQNDTPENE